MLEDIVDSINVNNLRDIIIWANGNHKSADCILDDLLGSSCLSCPFYVSYNLLKCASSDKLFDTLEWGNGVRYVWHTKTRRINEIRTNWLCLCSWILYKNILKMTWQEKYFEVY